VIALLLAALTPKAGDRRRNGDSEWDCKQDLMSQSIEEIAPGYINKTGCWLYVQLTQLREKIGCNVSVILKQLPGC